MPDISSIGHGSIGPINRAAGSSGPQAPAPAHDRSETRGDRVELSQHARLMDQLRQLREVRQDLVDRIKDEINAGAYDTDEKLEAAIEGLVADLRAEL